jgi:hypothetical protein
MMISSNISPERAGGTTRAFTRPGAGEVPGRLSNASRGPPSARAWMRSAKADAPGTGCADLTTPHHEVCD